MSFVTSLSDDNSSFTQPSFLFDFVYLKWPNPIFSPIISPTLQVTALSQACKLGVYL